MLFVALFAFFGLTAVLHGSGNDYDYTVRFTAYFDEENEIDVELDGNFGDIVTFDDENWDDDYEFAFFIVDGRARPELPLNHAFRILGDMEIEAISSPKNQHAVVFIDTNVELIEVKYVADGGNLEEPDVTYTEYTKPNYTAITTAEDRWYDPVTGDTSGTLANITASGVRVLRYEIDEESEYVLTVTEGEKLTPPNGVIDEERYIYNTVVEVKAAEPREDEKFSHWEVEGEVVSYAETHKLSVVEDTTITAVYVPDDVTVDRDVPLVTIRDVPLRDPEKTYLMQFYLPDGHELVDYGLLQTTDQGDDTLVFENDDHRVSARKHVGETREFIMSTNEDITAVKAYIVTAVGENLHYTYSRQVNFRLFGDGTAENPIEINNWNDLNSIRNEEAAFDPDQTIHFKLTSNLDKTTAGYNTHASETANADKGWEPLGYPDKRFTGHFDGDGHIIEDLVINRPDSDNVGLFGHVGVSRSRSVTVIENLYMKDADVTGNRGTGALIGRVTGNQATIVRNVGVIDSTVSGTGATGGLIGSFNSFATRGAADRNPRLQEAFVEVVEVEGRGGEDLDRTFEKIAGLVGCSQKGSISDSYALATVTITDAAADRVGVLVGCNVLRGRLERSYAAGTINLESDAFATTNVGILIGMTDANSVLNATYYDQQLDTHPGVGSHPDGIAGVTGFNTDDMQGEAAATNMGGLDFAEMWMTTTEYPRLKASEDFFTD